MMNTDKWLECIFDAAKTAGYEGEPDPEALGCWIVDLSQQLGSRTYTLKDIVTKVNDAAQAAHDSAELLITQNRYHLYMWERYEAEGGFSDFRAAVRTEDEAVAMVPQFAQQHQLVHWHVVDMATLKIVRSGKGKMG